jgi:hypothetical protein
MNLAMTPAEATVFTAFLRCAGSYLEFGAGGSTVKATQYVQGRIFSVDSSREWLSNVAKHALGDATRLHLEYVDIGPVADWGYPQSYRNKEAFAAYSKSIWRHVDAKTIDLYLIDGRFRVACFAECVKNARDDALFIVHDYNSRKQYHEINLIAKKVASVDDLAVFSSKAVDARTLAGFADRYRFDPS